MIFSYFFHTYFSKIKLPFYTTKCRRKTAVIITFIWYIFSPGEALQAFRWFDVTGGWPDLFAAWERYLVIYAGAAVMWLIAKKLKKRHQLKVQKVLRTYLRQCCRIHNIFLTLFFIKRTRGRTSTNI